MKFYDEYVLPHIINCVCGIKEINVQRQKIVPRAQGMVLEIGMGSALNLQHYDAAKVDAVWGLEPSEGMRKKAESIIEKCEIDVQWLEPTSEKIPLPDDVVDSIVMTYTLCSIEDVQAALAEMRRVLKPNGNLFFCEHGKAPDPSLYKWQKRVTPVWKRLMGGCHLDKPIPDLLRSSNFVIKELHEMYIPGPKLAAYNYWGVASL